MKNLEEMVMKHQANILPASEKSVNCLEDSLGFELSKEYKSYLSTFGVIAYEAFETYGLGVPENYYLHVNNIYSDLSNDPSYPKKAVPLLEIGDGQYYLYDNSESVILLWATPNGGVVKKLNISLEEFLIQHIFKN